MEPDTEGFLQPVIRTEQCVGCNRCRNACPILTERSQPDEKTEAYAAIHADEGIRAVSTSGGIFSLLCDWVFARGGIAFGAAYDAQFRVVHCSVEHAEDLYRLRGAKYAQSSLGDTFSQVREQLRKDRYVLFSGTPCQVGGLLSYLGKDYEKLILVDLICHGVPSPKVWQHYVDYRSMKDAGGQKPAGINLRSKETGWPGYSIRFDYPDGQFYSAPNTEDPYLRGFVGNLYLRQSCHNCRFKGSTRLSDFTLGDYWGVWSQLPEFHDGKGTSLVLLHTQKAKNIWAQAAAHMRCSEAPENSLADNPSALESSVLTEKRQQFFGRFEQEDFQLLTDEFCPRPAGPAKPSLFRRCLRKMRRILKRKSK